MQRLVRAKPGWYLLGIFRRIFRERRPSKGFFKSYSHYPEPEPIAFAEGPPALFDYANDWNPLVDLTQREIDPGRIDMDNRT